MDYKQKYLKYKNKYFNLKFEELYKEDYVIILTVPHSVPNVLINHNRKNDIMALNFALILKKLFEDNKFKVEIVVSSQSRNICDDNRPQALSNCIKEDIPTPLWQELNKIINSIKDKKILLIDTHSFPPGYHFDNNDIAFLENNDHTNAIGKKLCSIMEKKIKCNYYESSYNNNAIIDKNNDRVSHITLVEINEKYINKEYNDELNFLAKNFYESIIKIITKQTN